MAVMATGRKMMAEASVFTADDRAWMEQALALAARAEAEGEVPVGAIVADGQSMLGRGWNRNIALHDPSAHAEIVALREAGRKRGNHRLPGCVLYVTLEPCAMCVSAAIHARLDRIVDRFGATWVLHTSLLIAAARWLLIGWATGLGWLALGQTLHAATYAAFHVAAIRLVYRSFGSAQRARGQAMYSGMTFGLGMLIGSLLAGSLAELVGFSGLFYASAAVALAAVLVLGVRRSP